MLRTLAAPSLFWQSARLGVAMAALLVATMDGAVASPSLPYGSYAAERQMILEKLPCKWISMNGRDGIRRDDSGYDFLCKGGVWATVSLMMDEAKLQRDGIGRVRLLFREWPAEIHPGGGEAYVAQEFLQYVIGHFVPANMADAVQEGFWKNKEKTWKLKGLTISMGLEPMGNHNVRRLEIYGSVGAITPVVSMPSQTKVLPTAPIVPVEPQIEEPKGWGWLQQDETIEIAPKAVIKAEPKLEPVKLAPAPVLPTEELVGPGTPVPAIPVKVVTPTVAVAPVKVEAPKKEKKSGWSWLFNPAEHAAETSGPVSLTMPVVNNAAVSATLPKLAPVVVKKDGSVSDTTPPVFAAEPAPESLVAPTPPPAVSDTLVPTALERSMGRAAAPSQFDAYNKAEALTRQYEINAVDAPNANPKVTPAVPETPAAQESGLMKAPESTAVAPSLAPVPTPTLTTPTAAGLLNETAEEPAVLPSSDPRFVPERPMPQLKYVPKAQPAPKADQVIKFEDEKSGL